MRHTVQEFCAERQKLSDPAHEGARLQPGRDGRVRCSAWLGGRLSIVHFLLDQVMQLTFHVVKRRSVNLANAVNSDLTLNVIQASRILNPLNRPPLVENCRREWLRAKH